MYGLKIHWSNVPVKYFKSGVNDTSKIWYMFKQFQVQIRQVNPVVIALKSKIDLCGWHSNICLHDDIIAFYLQSGSSWWSPGWWGGSCWVVWRGCPLPSAGACPVTLGVSRSQIPALPVLALQSINHRNKQKLNCSSLPNTANAQVLYKEVRRCTMQCENICTLSMTHLPKFAYYSWADRKMVMHLPPNANFTPYIHIHLVSNHNT